MTTYKFLLIDDEKASRISGYREVLQQADNRLQIEHRLPTAFEEQMEMFAQNGIKFGVILDNKLDDNPEAAQNYRGPTLAQEIRTRAADPNRWREWTFPLIMLSMKNRISQFYEPDKTSHDLFDVTYSKEDLSENAQETARQMISLADGYSILRDSYGQKPDEVILRILGDNVDFTRLDPRVRAEFNQRNACHVMARFVLRGLLARPGMLLDEKILAARLGVDIQASEGWRDLRMTLDEFCYRGIFHEGWPRWWAQRLESWWRTSVRKKGGLSILSAHERVQALIAATSLKLVEAKPIEDGYSSRFWTICLDLQKPLDRVDGVRVDEPDPLPWQEPGYISIKAALHGPRDGLRPHPLESARLDALSEEEEEK